jgi:puromycin-sensitive aminopeptidase
VISSFIMDAFAFAQRCRCGTVKCNTHTKVENDKREILPPTVEPISYKLDISCRLDKFEFDGEVEIAVMVLQSVSQLTLHANELKVHSASFEGIGEATSITLDEKATTVAFDFAKPMPEGQGRLRIKYSGSHNNQMNGFYRSEYTDVAGNKKLMVSTQFESIDARKCLPCWDEPERKATFTCSLRVPTHMTALSNMPESRLRTHADGTKTVSFLESPKMSTYLLAFVVGEFDHVSALTSHGVLIRVFGPQGKPELGEFALECAVQALDRYDDTFGQPFPLPKQDMVAIPEFAMGAMENWGLVTYREVDLLIDANASSRQQQRVAEVVIHELAHQWFGNLVRS